MSEKSNCCPEKEEWELREEIAWFRIGCWGRDGNGEAQKSSWKSVWKRGKRARAHCRLRVKG